MKPVRRRGRTAALVGACALGLLLSSCETMTPYQPEVAGQRIHGGYSEERLGEGRYIVTFDGNTLTSRERVEGYMLYRAAELTIANGYDWFKIVDRMTETDRRTFVEPRYNPWFHYGYWRPYWRYYRPRFGWQVWYPYDGDPFWTDNVDVQTVEEYEAHAEVVMQHGAPPAGSNVFDARRIMTELGPSIERPKPK